MAETVFPNLVVARVVPEGPQTRAKGHGKCKWTAEAVFGEYMLLLLGVIKASFLSLCFLSVSNIATGLSHRAAAKQLPATAPLVTVIQDAFIWEV